MGSPWPTSVVPQPALAVKWGLGTPWRRSIWPKAVWESPAIPCRRQPVLTGSFHKQHTKPEILCFHLTHLPASPLRLPGYQRGGGGELVRANPWNWCPAPSEDRRAQAPGLCVPRWDRLHLGEAQELAHLSQPTAWELQGGRKGAGLGDRARPTEMCVHFSCWHDRLLGSL